MGVFRLHKKYFLLWPLVLVVGFTTPVQAMESMQEVEVSEEIKLYAHLKTNQNQKPLDKELLQFKPCYSLGYTKSENDRFLLTSKKYLLHCNLTFYE